ncbi:hypothetical protein SK128_004005 [Halocaridina rubra]|uniref:Uncharacterized protein n=1 Tax=Halocaridina rubra TaxID=373956 RepID=A0AAN8X747_HALRR
MKASIIIALIGCLALVNAIPAPGAMGGGGAGMGPFIPTAAMIQAFIPTPEEIAALNALNTTPVPGAPTTTPSGPPTMPPAVANLVNKYKMAVSAFIPPSPPTPVI